MAERRPWSQQQISACKPTESPAQQSNTSSLSTTRSARYGLPGRATSGRRGASFAIAASPAPEEASLRRWVNGSWPPTASPRSEGLRRCRRPTASLEMGMPRSEFHASEPAAQPRDARVRPCGSLAVQPRTARAPHEASVCFADQMTARSGIQALCRDRENAEEKCRAIQPNGEHRAKLAQSWPYAGVVWPTGGPTLT